VQVRLVYAGDHVTGNRLLRRAPVVLAEYPHYALLPVAAIFTATAQWC
jgi:hypothetical protein